MGTTPWGVSSTEHFTNLDHSKIMDLVDALGARTNGQVLALNSIENRVIELGLENEFVGNKSLIAKFYRPGRWSREQIQEEHDFLFELLDNELPVIAPLKIDGQSLFFDDELNMYYCIFPKMGGRLKAEILGEDVAVIARLLARMHSIGKSKPAKHRVKMDIESYGKEGLSIIINSDLCPDHLKESFTLTCQQMFPTIENFFNYLPSQRVHGDLHLGNILWQDEKPLLVDFDDFVTGPIIQDIWMILPLISDDQKLKNDFLDAYESMNVAIDHQLKYIEVMRTLRYIHFNAWVIKRWEDQSFKRHFPHFEQPRHWDQFYNDLREQFAKVMELNSYGQ